MNTAKRAILAPLKTYTILSACRKSICKPKLYHEQPPRGPTNPTISNIRSSAHITHICTKNKYSNNARNLKKKKHHYAEQHTKTIEQLIIRIRSRINSANHVVLYTHNRIEPHWNSWASMVSLTVWITLKTGLGVRIRWDFPLRFMFILGNK